MAMTKCKECKNAVSTKAKVCPFCGVKNPGFQWWQGLAGMVIFGVILYFIFGGDDKAEPSKTSAVKECTSTDTQCLFDKYFVKASTPCRQLVEKSSKYDFEWTDGIVKPMFTQAINKSAKNQLTYIGDRVKFTNGFNAKTTMTYACTYDWKANELVDFKISEGKL